MNQPSEARFALVMEILAALFAVSLSAGVGFLLGPGIGFLTMAGMVLACGIALSVSYARESRDDAEDES